MFDTLFSSFDDLLSTDEAAEALKIGKNQIYALLSSGELKGYRTGRRTWRIPRPALTEYVFRQAKLN
jgi:excisionase family DNA binding protein